MDPKAWEARIDEDVIALCLPLVTSIGGLHYPAEEIAAVPRPDDALVILDAAQALGRTEGLTKWLIDPESHRVIGCGIVGAGAGELIAEAVLAIEMGCEARDLTEAIHPHPTLSETLMNAGEVHFGTATEIFKPKKKPAPVA